MPVIDSGFAKVIRMSDLDSGTISGENAAMVAACVVDGLERFALSEGDFLFGMSGSLKNYAWINGGDLPAYLNQRVGKLNAKQPNVPRYLQYLFLSDYVQARIHASAVGAAQLNISANDLRKIKLKLPHPEEQTKIADALSALDAKIDAVSAQISQMEAFKKGLLQKMFV